LTSDTAGEIDLFLSGATLSIEPGGSLSIDSNIEFGSGFTLPDLGAPESGDFSVELANADAFLNLLGSSAGLSAFNLGATDSLDVLEGISDGVTNENLILTGDPDLGNVIGLTGRKAVLQLEEPLEGEVGATLRGEDFTLILTGDQPGTNTGDLQVGRGVSLELRKSAGVQAFGGRLIIDTGGLVQILSNRQLPAAVAVQVDGLLLLRGTEEAIGNLSGSGEIAPGAINAQLEIAGGDFAGSLNDGEQGGQLRLIKTSGASLSLNGMSLYTGGTEVREGELEGAFGSSLTGNFTVNEDATLTANQSEAAEFTGNLEGQGMFRKTGSALLRYNPTGDFAGDIRIDQGALQLQRDVTGNVEVQQRGALTGNGRVGGNLNVGGTLSPGGSVGTLSVAGDFNLLPTSFVVIELQSADSFDRITVSGTANLDGSLRVVLLDGFVPDDLASFDFLTAEGGVNGTFDEVVQPDEKGFTLAIGTNSVTLVAEEGAPEVVPARLSYAETPGLTVNTFLLASSLETIRGREIGFETDFDANVRPVLDALTPAERLLAFANLLPEQNGLFSQMAFDTSRVWMSELAFRLQDGLVATAQPLAEGDGGPFSGWSAWAGGSGIFSRAENLGPLRDGAYTTGTFTAGLHCALSETLHLGLASGYVASWVDLDAGGRLKSNGGRIGGYGAIRSGGWTFSGYAGGIFQSYEWARAVVLPGIQRLASASPDGSLFETFGSAGYAWQFANVTLHGFGQLEYTRLHVDGFTETGAGALGYRYGSQNANSLRSLLGVGIESRWRLTETLLLRPGLRLAWRHEYLDGSRSVEAALAGGLGPAFSTGLPASSARDSLTLTVGTGLQIAEHWALDLFYTGDYGNNNQLIHAVQGGVTLDW